MNISRLLVKVLASHEADHENHVRWNVHTQTKTRAGAKCSGCGLNIGVAA